MKKRGKKSKNRKKRMKNNEIDTKYCFSYFSSIDDSDKPIDA